MPRPPQPPELEAPADRWILSYADFITLLFALFAVLYAVSSLDARKWSSVSVGVKTAFVAAESDAAIAAGGAGERPVERAGRRTESRGSGAAAWEELLLRDHLRAILEDRSIAGSEREAPVRAAADERGLTIALASRAFFAPGSAEIEAGALPLLDEIGRAVATSDREIRVEGHADDAPADDVASSFELSGARAGAVARRLVEQHRIPPERVAIAGYGRWHPLEAGNAEANRRVEIVVLRSADPLRPASPGARREALEGVLEALDPLD